MTKRELIEALARLNDDDKVFVGGDPDTGDFDVVPIKLVEYHTDGGEASFAVIVIL